MSKIIGRLRSVGLAKESTKGTAVAPAYWLPYTGFNPNPVIQTKQKDGATGRIEAGYESNIISKYAQPSVDGILTDKAFGLLLLAGLGSVASVAKSAPNAVVCDHTFTVKNDNDHPALTMSYKDAIYGKQIAYSMLNKLEIEAKLGDFVRYKAEFLSKLEADGALTPAVTAENAFVPKHITVKIADTVAGLAGASAVALQSVKLSVNKNGEVVFGLGSDEPASIVNKELEISGDIECLLNDNSWKTLFTGGTSKAMSIAITSDTVIGTSGNPAVVFTFNKVVFNTYKENGSLKDLIKESVGFDTLYSVTDSKMVEAVLTNLATSY
jgi:hypothetical protein